MMGEGGQRKKVGFGEGFAIIGWTKAADKSWKNCNGNESKTNGNID